LNIGPGDAVVVPSMTFVATANMVRHTGAEVIFADVDPQSGLMGPEHLLTALENNGQIGRPRAVFNVHLNGQCGDLPGLSEISNSHRLWRVEDAAHAFGTCYDSDSSRKPQKVGSCADADMVIFSFHPAKNIAMGEGGAVATNDPVLDRNVRRARDQGLERDQTGFTQSEMAYSSGGLLNPWYYEMTEPGFNYRASDIHCALGLSQLGKLDHFIARRAALTVLYDRALERLRPLVMPIARQGGAPAWHLYPALIDFESLGVERAAVMAAMRESGIGTQVHYIPVHCQPYSRRRYGHLSLPGAEAYYDRCLSLPLHPNMADQDVERVVDALTKALKL